MKRVTAIAAFAAAIPAFGQTGQRTTPPAQQGWTSKVVFGAPWEDVPEPFHRLPIGRLDMPSSRAGWDRKRPEIHRILAGCLGEMPPRPKNLAVKTLSREQRSGYRVEKISIDNAVDSAIPAYIVVPDGARTPAPAILLLHWHSGNKEGVLFSKEEQNVLEPLVKRGFVLMAVDSYFNGDRLGTGPAGSREADINRQRDSLFKLNLWLGRTLWGMMLRDYQIALDYLSARPDVDPKRIGASGMSMGSTGAWWLAALDYRVKAVVAVACFMRYEQLIAHGQLRAHAIYFFVPGILRHFDTEAVLGLLAPRPLLALTGDSDPTSPPDGIRILEDKLNRFYSLYQAPERFRSVIYPKTGHRYLPQMKQEMADWFDRWLK